MQKIAQIQIGKNKITNNFISTLKSHFEKHRTVKVSVLKSAGHEKSQLKEYAERILKHLGENYSARVIGFTIVLRKWRRPKTSKAL